MVIEGGAEDVYTDIERDNHAIRGLPSGANESTYLTRPQTTRSSHSRLDVTVCYSQNE